MLFVMMVVMFVLSTVYWVISVVITFLLMRAWFSELDPATHSPPGWLPMFNAVLLVNVSTKLFTALHPIDFDTFSEFHF
jgi:hypothetical protein